MAAAAVTWLEGGDNEQVATAAVALTIQGMLGLICDPVAGLVEIPCAYRNASAAVNAVASAEMALAGLDFPIPVDQVVDVMGDVGTKMDVRFRETALGGLAATPAGQEIAARAGMTELVQLQRKGRTRGEGRPGSSPRRKLENAWRRRNRRFMNRSTNGTRNAAGGRDRTRRYPRIAV